MKIKVLAATAVLALFAVTSASAHDLNVKNNSTKAVAIGGNTSGGGGYGVWGVTGLFTGAGGGALAGSVYVSNACDCDIDTVILNNTSVKALAVGSAVSGSIVMR